MSTLHITSCERDTARRPDHRLPDAIWSAGITSLGGLFIAGVVIAIVFGLGPSVCS